MTEGLGLGISLSLLPRLFIVVEVGNLGGGILSCFGGGGGLLASLPPAACEALAVFFEPDRFQPRLSFLRNEVVEDGVGGSSGLETSAGVSVLATLFTFKARGPVNLAGLFSFEMSIVIKSPLVFDRGMRCWPALFLGSDEDRYGEVSLGGGRLLAIGIGFDPALVSNTCDEDSVGL